MKKASPQLSPWKPFDQKQKIPQTPFYLYSEDRLEDILKAHKKAFANFPIPIEHHFAFKSNNNPSVLKKLKNQNFGADVVSGNELKLALRHGYDPEHIVFSGVGKTREELILAVQAGISLLNIESEFEFNMLQDIVENASQKIRISFRINPDVNAKSHPYISTGLKSHKFGLDLKTAKKLFDQAAKSPNFDVCAVDVHIGSQLQDLRPLREALSKTLAFIKTLSPQAQGSIRTLDVGGGLGINYKNPRQMPDFQTYAKILKDTAQLWMKQCQHPHPKMICENGRAIIAASGLLVTRVIGIKDTSRKAFLVVDASMSELMRPSLYQARHEIFAFRKSSTQNSYAVVGPVCESSDSFGEGFKLPKSLKENDLLGIECVGAYGATMSHFYNGRDLPSEYWLSTHGELRLSRAGISFMETLGSATSRT